MTTADFVIIGGGITGTSELFPWIVDAIVALTYCLSRISELRYRYTFARLACSAVVD